MDYRDQSMSILNKLDRTRCAGQELIERIDYFFEKQDWDNAHKFALRSLESGRKTEDDRSIGIACTYVGAVHHAKGELSKAIEYYDSSRKHLWSDSRNRSIAFLALAFARQEQGQWTGAFDAYESCLHILKGRDRGLYDEIEECYQYALMSAPSGALNVLTPVRGPGRQVPRARIAAGELVLSEENIESPVTIDYKKAGPIDFALTVHGDSMLEDGIFDGDTVLLEQRNDKPPDGVIVAISIPQLDDEAIIKRFYDAVDHIRLEPANRRYPWVIIKPESLPEREIRRHYARSAPNRKLKIYSADEPRILGWVRALFRREILARKPTPLAQESYQDDGVPWPFSSYELGVKLFEAAGFHIDSTAEAYLRVTHDSREWQDGGDILVYCFEEGHVVTAKEIRSIGRSKSNEDSHRTCSFILFHERLSRDAVQALRRLRENKGSLIVPIHAAEARHILLQPRSAPNLAYRRLVSLKRQWTSLVDPYSSLDSVADPQWFFGKQRQVMIQEILAGISTGMDYSVVYGMRRVGKTTLLNQLALACQEQRYPVAKILCRRLSAEYTYAEVLSDIIQEWGAALEILYPDITLQSPELMIERYSLTTAQRFKTDFFRVAGAAQQQPGQTPRFVLILDEMDNIFPNQQSLDETYYQFCTLAQILKGVAETPDRGRILSVIVAMEYPWIHLIDRFPHNKRYQNPLYGRFKLRPVELLEREDWNDMVQTFGELAGLDYSDENLDVLYQYSSGHPEITRSLCSCLIELRNSGKLGSHLTAEDAYTAVDHFLQHPHHVSHLETTFWRNPLSTDLDAEQTLVQALAREKAVLKEELFSQLLERYKESVEIRTGTPVSTQELEIEESRLTRAMEQLTSLRIVAQDKKLGTCTIRIPIYRDWIRKEVLALEIGYTR